MLLYYCGHQCLQILLNQNSASVSCNSISYRIAMQPWMLQWQYIRPHCMHRVQRCSPLLQIWLSLCVCLSVYVCFSVWPNREPKKNHLISFGFGLGWRSGHGLVEGLDFPQEKRQFRGTRPLWVAFHQNSLTTLHPFNGPFSGTTQVSRYQKGKTNLDFIEARDSG